MRDLDTMLKMYKAGANRFGVGWKSAEKLCLEAVQRCKDGPIHIHAVSLDD